MIQGSGTIENYGSYISNCTLGQRPYKIPVLNLQDVQLYINIGGQPDAAQYQLIHTCGPYAGNVETLTTSSYVIGQKPNNDWYGVFKNFNNTANPLSCFVIAITLTFGELDVIYFSEEYCIDNSCSNLTLIKGCYGNLNNKISYGCNGVYFGTHANEDSTPMGDPTVVYQHQLYLRDVEVTLQAIKNTFKQGRTRNFRTEKEKIYQFWAELIPEWYMSEVDAIFYRGEVYVDGVKYLVNDTGYEKVEDCKKVWKPTATFKDSCYQSFSCEEDPCLPPVEESGGSGGGETPEESGESGGGGPMPGEKPVRNMTNYVQYIEDSNDIAPVDHPWPTMPEVDRNFDDINHVVFTNSGEQDFQVSFRLLDGTVIRTTGVMASPFDCAPGAGGNDYPPGNTWEVAYVLAPE
jgi:hypothetical protein